MVAPERSWQVGRQVAGGFRRNPGALLEKADWWRVQRPFICWSLWKNCVRMWDDFCSGSKKNPPANNSPGKANRLGHHWSPFSRNLPESMLAWGWVGADWGVGWGDAPESAWNMVTAAKKGGS